jgi:hypothetical protein
MPQKRGWALLANAMSSNALSGMVHSPSWRRSDTGGYYWSVSSQADVLHERAQAGPLQQLRKAIAMSGSLSLTGSDDIRRQCVSRPIGAKICSYSTTLTRPFIVGRCCCRPSALEICGLGPSVMGIRSSSGDHPRCADSRCTRVADDFSVVRLRLCSHTSAPSAPCPVNLPDALPLPLQGIHAQGYCAIRATSPLDCFARRPVLIVYLDRPGSPSADTRTCCPSRDDHRLSYPVSSHLQSASSRIRQRLKT